MIKGSELKESFKLFLTLLGTTAVFGGFLGSSFGAFLLVFGEPLEPPEPEPCTCQCFCELPPETPAP